MEASRGKNEMIFFVELSLDELFFLLDLMLERWLGKTKGESKTAVDQKDLHERVIRALIEALNEGLGLH